MPLWISNLLAVMVFVNHYEQCFSSVVLKNLFNQFRVNTIKTDHLFIFITKANNHTV